MYFISISLYIYTVQFWEEISLTILIVLFYEDSLFQLSSKFLMYVYSPEYDLFW